MKHNFGRRGHLTAGAVLLAAIAAFSWAYIGQSNERPSQAITPTVPAAIGAYLNSDVTGVNNISGFQSWLGGPEITVGRSYLASQSWSDIEGPDWVLNPWSTWVKAKPNRIFVLNVPMLSPNEPGSAGNNDSQISTDLQRGARGEFNAHYRKLAERLVAKGASDTTLVLGWEMSGFDFRHRCAPNPTAWKAYWIQIHDTMRSVPGQDFVFNFNPNRGPDKIRFQDCWPGDQYVDEIGIDAYDQPAGSNFSQQRTEPNGLDQIAAFAAAHGNKPLSIPEWGLFRNGDNPAYIQGMYDWITTHNVRWQSITDYCNHGVWRCTQNPNSSARYRSLFKQVATPNPPTPPPAPAPAGQAREAEQGATAAPAAVRNDPAASGGRAVRFNGNQ
jgi:hypothetical protein